MNQDESQRCIELGLSALRSKDFPKAIRLFEKSVRLHPSAEGKSYLELALEKQHQSQSQPGPVPPPSAPSTPNYTQEQESFCKVLLSKENYYEILNVPQDASVEDLKKAYKRLALKLHPDKNQAPGATEAFKAVNKAASCLTDSTKRKQYDLTGTEEAPGRMCAHSDEVFAEQLFRQFFNESFFFPNHTMNRTFHYSGPQRERTERQPNRWALVQLLPLLLLFLISFFSSLSSSSPSFSLHRTSYYTVLQRTSGVAVEYWLEPSFARELTVQSKRELDTEVEEYYSYWVLSDCQKKKQQKEALLRKSRFYSGAASRNYKESAERVDLSSCEEYQRLSKVKY